TPDNALAAQRAENFASFTAADSLCRHGRARMGQRVVEPLHKPVFTLADARNANGEIVRQPDIRHAADFETIVRTVGNLERSGIVAAGLLRIELDRAANRVAAG